MIFAPMLHVMSETNGNDSQTCVVCARDFLDDSLFCSTCASISFEGFGNFDNSDVFETQASFDDVLDDSGKFSGLEEFWKFRPGLVGNLTGAEDAAESAFLDLLLATETCSLSQCLSVWSPLVSTFVSSRRPDGSVGMVVLASADRLPVVVRIPAGPLGSLQSDPPKGNGRPQKIHFCLK